MSRLAVSTPTRTRTPGAVLLQRRGLVYLPLLELPEQPVTPAGGEPPVPDPVVSAGVTLLEADLLERGLLMSVPLRRRLERADSATLADVGVRLLSDVDAALGADRTMVPLFRGFPRSTPRDTLALWVDRVLAVLFQDPEQPCILCGQVAVVTAVSPCAHLVCRACFDGADYSACPICYRALDPDDPFLQPRQADRTLRQRSLPSRTRLAGAGEDLVADAHAEVAALLARTAALSPQDRDDLVVLLDTHSRENLGWLPEEIPGRETNAVVLDWLVGSPEHWSATLPVVEQRLGTATDALRFLTVRGGGDAGLVRSDRFAPVPRPVRRTVLAALDRMEPRTLVEDLHRHARRWRHAAERLHPYESIGRFPTAAAAFAALRGTALLDGRLVDAVERAGLPVVDGRVDTTGFGTRLEGMLARRDIPAAVRLLATRPGELLRRCNALLTRDPSAAQAVLAALPSAARAVAPAVLLSALGTIRARAATSIVDGKGGPAARVIFPKGADAKAHVMPDERPPLPAGIVARVEDILVAELLARCAALEPVGVALVDARLTDLVAPFTQRAAARALLTLPRGSTLDLPPATRLRLFLHWMQGAARVDLDLSVAIFDGAWEHIGTCDYTSLRWENDAAVHSGDRTDAPEPDGASEFLDLDLDALAAAGARHLVVSVFSYNNVAFDDMSEAFAGLMALSDVEGPAFDARAVELRFDLTGRARATVPFVVDIASRRLHWLDVAKGVTGTFHAVHRHSASLGLLGETLPRYFASPARVRLGEVAVWHAAARARTVLRRDGDGRVAAYRRRPDETVPAFASRIAAGMDPDPVPSDPLRAQLAFVHRGDVAIAAGATVYALFPANLNPETVRPLAAEDLAALLGPRSTTGD